MGRLIEAEKLWKAITTQIEEYCDITDLIEIIETQPTVDAEPVRHGRWINHFDDIWPEESTMECSLCHEEQGMGMLDTNYCPNCGAKMDEKEDTDG